MVKPELYIDSEQDMWGDDTNDEPGFGMSGWLTGANGAFRIPYRSDFKFGTGDYTVVQTFNALASGGTRVATYDDFTASTGLRLSQISDTFTVDSGDVSVNLPSNPLDGTNHYLLVERDAGVAVNAYLDDFSVVTASGNDAGTNISNTEPLDLAYDGVTYMDGLLGTTIVFNRLLEVYEKDDLFYWIQSNYEHDMEPIWLRDAATLYVNPNDPVQRAEYGVREQIINLGVTVPSEFYVRYGLTSDDGIDNPELQFLDLKVANLRYYDLIAEKAYEGGPASKVSLGHGQQPNIGITGSTLYNSVVIPVGELGTSWLAGDWTVMFWAELASDTTLHNVLVQDGSSVFAVRDEADNSLSLLLDNVEVLRGAIGAGPYSKYTMVTIKNSSGNYEMFFDSVSVDTGTHTQTASPTGDLMYDINSDGVIGPLHIWKRALSSSEIQAVYNSTPGVEQVLGGDTVTITDGFSTESLNWERL